MAINFKGPWNSEQTAEFLQQARIPLRLACVGTDGFPRVVSLWYRYEQGHFYCVTHRDSKIAAVLQGNNKVGFEVAPNEPPYHGIRGQGLATLLTEGAEETLRQHLQDYLGGSSSSLAQWLLSRAEEELLIRVEAQRVFTWDYRERMANTG
ncbi:MAG: pyridoxamine 5'-phosphate oxidase family protein [Marinobacter sp.]|uniref:pyridoxamine 5'-phosphate oxidase family protein n=1 Tax=Marinobacter sp. TaxID=50741 RepID=UPI0032995BFD